MKIVCDDRLQVVPHHLEVTVIDGALHVPAALMRVLDRIGVLDAAYLPSLLENMPSLFVEALGLNCQRLTEIQAALRAALESHVELPVNDSEFMTFG